MGMCLDITVKQKGINAKEIEDLLPDFKNNRLVVDQYADRVQIEYEGSYTGGVMVQNILHEKMPAKSIDNPIYMMVADFESESLFFKIANGQPSQEITAYEYNIGEKPNSVMLAYASKRFEHKHDDQIEYRKLCDLYSYTESEPLHNALIDRMNVLQDQTELFVWCIWKDCIQLVYIGGYDGDDDSPNYFSWNIEDFTVYPDNNVEHYDAGCLWGYVSAVEAAENELGVYDSKLKPQIYEADFNDKYFSKLVDKQKADYERLLSHIRTLPKYTGDYLKGLVVNE